MVRGRGEEGERIDDLYSPCTLCGMVEFGFAHSTSLCLCIYWVVRFAGQLIDLYST